MRSLCVFLLLFSCVSGLAQDKKKAAFFVSGDLGFSGCSLSPTTETPFGIDLAEKSLGPRYYANPLGVKFELWQKIGIHFGLQFCRFSVDEAFFYTQLIQRNPTSQIIPDYIESRGII